MAQLTRGDSGQRNQGSGTNDTITIGLVTENVDPDELGRIKVQLPFVPGAQSFWIRQATPMAGEDRGLYAIPEKGDEVLVAFVNGAPAMGVVLGGVWNGVDKPPTEAKDGMPTPADTDTGATWSTEQFTAGSTSLDANDRRFWKSRSGHLFVFDDTGGAETIQIWDKEHTLSFVFDSVKKLITIANTEGDLHIRTKNDLYLEAGHDIKFRSGNDTKVETVASTEWKAQTSYTQESGTETKFKAGTTAKYEATTTMDVTAQTTTVEGKVQATLKGGMVQINGDSMVMVQSATIKLN